VDGKEAVIELGFQLVDDVVVMKDVGPSKRFSTVMNFPSSSFWGT